MAQHIDDLTSDDDLARDQTPRPSARPLRWHLLLLVLASLLPMLAMTIALLLLNADTRRQQAENSLLEVTRSLTLTIEQDIESVFAKLALINQLGSKKDTRNLEPVLTPEEFDELGPGLINHHPHWRQLFLADGYGSVQRQFRISRGADNPADNVASILPTIREAIISGKPVLSDRLPDPGDQSSRVALVYPLIRNGQVEAVLGLTMAINHWRDHFLALKRENTFVGALLGQDGRVLLITRTPTVPDTMRAPDWFIDATAIDPSGIIQGPTAIGEVHTIAYQRLEGRGWILSSSLPSAVLFAPLWRGLWITGGFGALMIGLAVLFSLWQSRRMVTPIRQLITTSSALERGELVPPGPPSPIQELNELAQRLVTVGSRLHATNAERQQLLAEESRRRQVAELANKAKASVLATASHDLRQPFQAMRLYHHLICQDTAGQRAKDNLARLGDAIDSGEALLNALLDISTLETGNVHLEITDFPLEPLLQAKLGEVQKQATDKGLRIATRPTTAIVRSDRLLLGRIIGNLLSNAVRYTDEGSVQVSARTEGGHLTIEISDTGIGIPPDRLNSIFEEFVRVEGPTRDHRKGLGIGLAVVKRSAELLGHTLTVKSEPGKGSVFAITLPLADGNQQEVTDTPPVDRLLRILIVVRDTRERAMLRQLLEDDGHQVETAADDEAALALIPGPANHTGREPPLTRGEIPAAPIPAIDLVITDHAPRDGINGYRLLSLVCGRLASRVPAIFLTDEPDESGQNGSDPRWPDKPLQKLPGPKMLIATRHRPIIPADVVDLVRTITASGEEA